MIINELVLNQDSCFTDIQCRMTIKQKIVAKNGRVEMFGDNQCDIVGRAEKSMIIFKASLKWHLSRL